MSIDKFTQILQELHNDKHAMMPPGLGGIAKAASGATKGAAKLGGSAGKAGVGEAGGGLGDILGQVQQSGNPMEQVKGVLETHAGNDIKQNEEQIKQMQEALKNVETQIGQMEQQIKAIDARIQYAKSKQQNTVGLELPKQRMEEALAKKKEDKAQIEKSISQLEAADAKLKKNVMQERKGNIVGMLGPEGMVAQAVVGKFTNSQDDKRQAAADEAVQAAESAMDGASESAPAPSVPEPAPAPSTEISSPSSSPAPEAAPASSSSSSGGGGSSGGSPGRGIGGFATNLFSGGGGGSSEPQNAPIGSILAIIGSLILGVFVWRNSGANDVSILLPALLPIGLFILALLILIKTRGNRGWLALLIIIGLLGAAAVLFATMTFPHLLAAWQTGLIAQSSQDTQAAASKGVGSLFEDAISSYRKNVAAATGERIEGDVDNTVKDEVGIEILPPYLPNPKQINQNEIQFLELGARIKGFDPKTPITVAALCHMQTRDSATSVSRTTSQAGKGPRTDLGPEQEVQPQSIAGHTFDKEITCYPSMPTNACGNYVTTISAQADRLRTDAQMINYVIDETILNEQLHEYAVSFDRELKSESEVRSAMDQIYKGQLGSIRSVSDKGAIKVVMAAAPLPLIGINPLTESNFKLRVGIENMMNGWVTEVNNVRVQIPGFFRPSERCAGWIFEEGWLVLTDEYLRTANFKETIKGQQKIFPSCMLVPTGQYPLTEPTEATFLAAVDYNYIVQQEIPLEVRNSTGGICRETTPMSGSSESLNSQIEERRSALQRAQEAREDQSLIRDKEACSNKNEGESCGSNKFCLNLYGEKICVPNCMYYSNKGEQGLTSSYDCKTPASACSEGSIKSQFTCSAGWLEGSWVCCI